MIVKVLRITAAYACLGVALLNVPTLFENMAKVFVRQSGETQFMLIALSAMAMLLVFIYYLLIWSE